MEPRPNPHTMLTESGGGGGNGFALPPASISNEDIIFCIDVGPESAQEMKVPGPNGRPVTRIDSIKQAILLFIHSKLAINPDHRFAFTVLGKSASWLKKEFSSDADSASAALQRISIEPSASHADLTQLFRVAVHEAKKSRAQNRTLRLVLLYCRSSTPPQHQWAATQKFFTVDVMYLHDKPGPDNCPQEVYDALAVAIDKVSEYEGFILESGQGLARILFRNICVLLAHPQQRCVQDDIDFPKSLTKKSPLPETMAADETVPMSSQS